MTIEFFTIKKSNRSDRNAILKNIRNSKFKSKCYLIYLVLAGLCVLYQKPDRYNFWICQIWRKCVLWKTSIHSRTFSRRYFTITVPITHNLLILFLLNRVYFGYSGYKFTKSWPKSILVCSRLGFYLTFIEFSEFRESEKSLKHKLGSV